MAPPPTTAATATATVACPPGLLGAPACNSFPCVATSTTTTSTSVNGTTTVRGTCACGEGWQSPGDFAWRDDTCTNSPAITSAIFTLGVIMHVAAMAYASHALVKRRPCDAGQPSRRGRRRRHQGPARLLSCHVNLDGVLVLVAVSAALCAAACAVRAAAPEGAPGYGVDLAPTVLIAVALDAVLLAGWAFYVVTVRETRNVVYNVTTRVGVPVGGTQVAGAARAATRTTMVSMLDQDDNNTLPSGGEEEPTEQQRQKTTPKGQHRITEVVYCMFPLVFLVFTVAAFMPIASALRFQADSTLAATTSLIHSMGRLHFALSIPFAFTFGMMIGPLVLLALAREVSAVAEAFRQTPPAHWATSDVDDLAASLAVFATRLRLLAYSSAVGAGSMVPVFAALAASERFLVTSASYVVPLAFAVDANLLLTATWVLVNAFASSSNVRRAVAAARAASSVASSAGGHVVVAAGRTTNGPSSSRRGPTSTNLNGNVAATTRSAPTAPVDNYGRRALSGDASEEVRVATPPPLQAQQHLFDAATDNATRKTATWSSGGASGDADASTVVAWNPAQSLPP